MDGRLFRQEIDLKPKLSRFTTHFIFAKVENDEKKQVVWIFIADYLKDPGVYFGEDIPKQGLKGYQSVCCILSYY